MKELDHLIKDHVETNAVDKIRAQISQIINSVPNIAHEYHHRAESGVQVRDTLVSAGSDDRHVEIFLPYRAQPSDAQLAYWKKLCDTIDATVTAIKNDDGFSRTVANQSLLPKVGIIISVPYKGGNNRGQAVEHAADQLDVLMNRIRAIVAQTDTQKKVERELTGQLFDERIPYHSFAQGNSDILVIGDIGDTDPKDQNALKQLTDALTPTQRAKVEQLICNADRQLEEAQAVAMSKGL